MIERLKRLRAAFGASFLWLVCLIYFTQGFRYFVWTAVSYQLKDRLKLSPSSSQIVFSIPFFPWSIKPLYGDMLASRAIACLNVDSAVYAPGFWASATPQLDKLLKQATQQVKDLNNSSQTLYQAWVGSSSSPRFSRLGSGESDFAAFVQNNGIPSADMTFCKGYPVYHAIPCMMTLYGWKIW